MINKYTLSRFQNVSYVKANLDDLVENNLSLSRYAKDDPLYATAKANFEAAYDFILNEPDLENDYKCLIRLHEILMKGLDDGIKCELSAEQIAQLSEMINQPAKANLEIAIDVALYILDKRLFADGDVRAALLFANKIMIDNGCGVITVPTPYRDTFRAMLHDYKENGDPAIKDWIYKYCIKGPKLEY